MSVFSVKDRIWRAIKISASRSLLTQYAGKCWWDSYDSSRRYLFNLQPLVHLYVCTISPSSSSAIFIATTLQNDKSDRKRHQINKTEKNTYYCFGVNIQRWRAKQFLYIRSFLRVQNFVHFHRTTVTKKEFKSLVFGLAGVCAHVCVDKVRYL